MHADDWTHNDDGSDLRFSIYQHTNAHTLCVVESKEVFIIRMADVSLALFHKSYHSVNAH